MSQVKSDITYSAQITESLPGTAKIGKLFIALEHQFGWSHDIFDGGVQETEITGQVEAWLSGRGGMLQLIRKPGRIGQQPCDGVNVYIAHRESVNGSEVFLEHRVIVDVEDLMTLGIRLDQPTGGATRLDCPLFLTCTHGKCDRCCAIKGHPLATAMYNLYLEVVWETSHSKGHRFAPANVPLPWDYNLGCLSAVDAKGAIEDAQQGIVHAEGCRGRGIYTPQGQATELAVRRQADAWGADDVACVDVDGTTAVVTSYDGPNDRDKVVEYEMALEKTTMEGVTFSCGDALGSKKGWAAAEVARRQLATS